MSRPSILNLQTAQAWFRLTHGDISMCRGSVYLWTTHHCAHMHSSQQFLWIVRSASGPVGWGQSRYCDRKLLTWSRCKDKRPPSQQLQNMDRQWLQTCTGSPCSRELNLKTLVHVIYKTNMYRIRFQSVPVFTELLLSHYWGTMLINVLFKNSILRDIKYIP